MPRRADCKHPLPSTVLIANLDHLPCHRIEVDKTFIDGPSLDPQTSASCRDDPPGHSLDRKVVAEGVETPEQWDFLVDMGCDLVQGYHIAHPMPPESVADFVTNSPWSLAN